MMFKQNNILRFFFRQKTKRQNQFLIADKSLKQMKSTAVMRFRKWHHKQFRKRNNED